MNMTNSNNTCASPDAIFDVLDELYEDYELQDVAEAVMRRLYWFVLEELSLDYRAADEIMAQAARATVSAKTHIEMEIASISRMS